MNLKEYITEYVSSGRSTYRLDEAVNKKLDELNKFMNDNPVALEACTAKVGMYDLFEIGYIPEPWILYYRDNDSDDRGVDRFKIRMTNTDGSIWICDGDNPIGNSMRAYSMGKIEPISTMDPSETQINMTIKDGLPEYARINFLKPIDEMVEWWYDEVLDSIIKTYGAGKIKKERNDSLTISLNDFDGAKMIKAFKTVDNKKFWEKLVIK